MTRCRAAVVVVVLAGLASPRLMAAPTPLQAALDLYAAASYEEALAALDTVSPAGLTIDDQVLVAQHRMLCLMAIGRTADAERVAATLLALRPEFLLGARDASPRVRTMFDTARRRVLPAIVRERFATARTLYDTGALADARAAFASVAQALGDAALVASDPALGDLRTLADGFVALTTAAAAPRVAPAAPVEAPPTQALPVAPLEGASTPLVAFPRDSSVTWREGESPADRADSGPADRIEAPAAPAAAPEIPAPSPDVDAVASALPTVAADANVATLPEAPPAPSEPVPGGSTAMPAGAPFTPIDIFTYDWRDKDVAPPVPVAQAVSGWWGSMGEPPAGTPLGAVDLVIDEHGKVIDAKIHLSVNRVYDAVLLASVGQWRYQPARRGGRPVKYRRISGVVSGR